MKKKFYIFKCSDTDDGTLARLSDDEAKVIWARIKALPLEIEFFLVKAEAVTYGNIVHVIDTDVLDYELKKRPRRRPEKT